MSDHLCLILIIMKLNSITGLSSVEVIDDFKKEFFCKVVIKKMPDYNRLREICKKQYCDSDFKSF